MSRGGLRARPVRAATELGLRTVTPMGRNYAVLREPLALAVVVEPLFATHPADENLALRPDHADRMAGCLVAGLSDYVRRAGGSAKTAP